MLVMYMSSYLIVPDHHILQQLIRWLLFIYYWTLEDIIQKYKLWNGEKNIVSYFFVNLGEYI